LSGKASRGGYLWCDYATGRLAARQGTEIPGRSGRAPDEPSARLTVEQIH
jgi:hypothetical protein